MKKVILSLSLSLALLAGSAQTQQKPIILQVTPEAYQLIINALAELPAKTSYMLITGLNQQYAQQMQGANVPVGSDTTKTKKPVVDKPKTEKKN